MDERPPLPLHSAHPHSAPRFFAVIPAAGRSVRMGQPKLLLPWAGRTLVEHVIAQWLASRASRVIVVVHRDDVELAQACRRAGATIVVPAIPPPDMKSSVGHALSSIGTENSPTSTDAWLLAPADMPRLNMALIDFIIAAHDPNAPRIIVPTSGGRRGHPVLFPWAMAAEVACLGPDEGLNLLVNRGPVRELEWPDDGPLVDIDTPADYRRWQDDRQG
jgi:molybdenum cofactor cytidylyltransferase